MKKKIKSSLIIFLIVSLMLPVFNGSISFAATEKASIKCEEILKSGNYKISSKLSNSLSVKFKQGGADNGEVLKLFTKTNDTSADFELIYNNDKKSYTILNNYSGKVLDVPSATKDSGTNLQQYKSNGTEAQEWVLKDAGNGYYYIVSKLSGLYLDVPSAKAEDGAKLQLYAGNKTNAQMFKFSIVETPTCSEVLASGEYAITTALSSSKSLRFEDGSYSLETPLEVSTKTDATFQNFQLKYNKNNKSYSIISSSSGLYLDVSGAKKLNRTKVQEYKGNGTTAQEWILLSAGSGYYYIVSKSSGLYLDIPGGSADDGTNLQIFEGNKSNAQKFKFVSKAGVNLTCSAVVSNGIYNITSALNSNKVLDIDGGSFSNGTNLQIWSKSTVQQKKFQLKYDSSDKSYEIISVNSGKVLDVSSAKECNGANVQQYESNGSNAQKWILKSAGNGYYYIISKANGLALDITHGSTSNGANVWTYELNNSTAQKFKFETVQIIENNSYKINTKNSSNQYFDISGGSTSNGANLQTWSKSKVDQQVFAVTKVSGVYYKIVARHSGKALTVKDGNIIQSTYTGADTQLWSFEVGGNGYYKIKSKSAGLYADIESAGTESGTNVQVYKGNSTNAQKFRFETVTSEFGVDISYYNTITNWKTLSKNIDFAILRVGYRGWGSSGKLMTDSKFLEFAKNAKDNNVKIGLYFFTQAITVAEAKEEANYVLKLVRDNKISVNYPIIIDTEYSTASDHKGRADNLSKSERTAICKAFCETIKSAGYTPGIYASKYWFYDNLNFSDLSSYEIWLAHYTDSASKTSDFKYNYDMWQYTSIGSVSGITGDVDLNISYKAY